MERKNCQASGHDPSPHDPAGVPAGTAGQCQKSSRHSGCHGINFPSIMFPVQGIIIVDQGAASEAGESGKNPED